MYLKIGYITMKMTLRRFVIFFILPRMRKLENFILTKNFLKHWNDFSIKTSIYLMGDNVRNTWIRLGWNRLKSLLFLTTQVLCNMLGLNIKFLCVWLVFVSHFFLVMDKLNKLFEIEENCEPILSGFILGGRWRMRKHVYLLNRNPGNCSRRGNEEIDLAND